MATPAPPPGQVEEAVGEMVQSRVHEEEREKADADPASVSVNLKNYDARLILTSTKMS